MPLRRQILLLVGGAVLILFGALLLNARQHGAGLPSTRRPVHYPPATYVGHAACVDCHEQAQHLWRGSDHDLAMQVADEDTVLGDFDDATFSHFGVTSRFFKKDGRFFVNTDGPDGEMHDYQIAYTFGVRPLQQYLVAFPGGRYQVLSLCWDARPKEAGGQRWYHLYGDEPIPPTDELHWTGPNQNWNYMCAECHSTDFKKNYDPAKNAYHSTWKEINVSCEACHGPGSNHVQWAKDHERGVDRSDPTLGLTFMMKDDGGVWQFAPDAVTAQRSKPRTDHTMMQMCARCHARRTTMTDDYQLGHDLLDTHQLALLDEGLYFPDGQIQDEVYVYGSFLQSKMYRKGVTCTNCHDPHSTRTLIPGNALCSQCHLPEHFDTPEHHFHEQGSEGASCIACHMPTRTYMGVDVRRDHSLRVPRPGLTIKTGSPNACNQCHDDQTPQWAEQKLDEWYGPKRHNEPHYGEAIFAGRQHTQDANKKLIDLIDDAEQPAIARATAVSLLRNYPTAESYRVLQNQAKSSEPLVRMAVPKGLESFEPAQRLPIAFDLLSDPIRMVRLEAGRVLAPVNLSAMDDAKRQAIEQGIESYIDAQLTNADRAESYLNIGLVRLQQGNTDAAEKAYRDALRVNPRFVQAYVNLADLYRADQHDDKAIELLQSAIDNRVDHGVIYYALGLALVRQQKIPEAMKMFEHAVEATPEDPRFAYTLGIALNSIGQPGRALDVLAKNYHRHPDDMDTLFALMAISRDQHRFDDALRYADALLKLNPPNARAVRAFINQRKQVQADTMPADPSAQDGERPASRP